MPPKKKVKKSSPKKAPSNKARRKQDANPISKSQKGKNSSTRRGTSGTATSPSSKPNGGSRTAKPNRRPSVPVANKRRGTNLSIKKLKSETSKTAKNIERNLKATKKAVKQIRDAFAKAVKKASKKESKKHAAKQSPTSSKTKKAASKNPARKSATQQKAAKATARSPGPGRGNRKQATGSQGGKRTRSSSTGQAARNRPTGTRKTQHNPPRGLKPGQPSYTLQELASSKARNMAKLLKRIEENANSIDQLKRPDQLWTFQIYDRHSLAVYESIAGMMEFLQASGGLIVSVNENAGLFSKVSILTRGEIGQSTEDAVREFIAERDTRRAAQQAENAAIMKRLGQRFGRLTKEGRRKSKAELLQEAEAEIVRLEAEARMKREGVKSRRKK